MPFLDGQFQIVEWVSRQCGIDGEDGGAEENDGADQCKSNAHGGQARPAQLLQALLQLVENGRMRRFRRWRRCG